MVNIFLKDSQFVSLSGEDSESFELKSEKLEAEPYSNEEIPPFLSTFGDLLDKIITWTIFGIIAFNSFFGGSSPLLWGWLNSVQIIYFFPLLGFEMPFIFTRFLQYFKASDLSIDIDIKSEYVGRFEQTTFTSEDVSDGAINDELW